MAIATFITLSFISFGRAAAFALNDLGSSIVNSDLSSPLRAGNASALRCRGKLILEEENYVCTSTRSGSRI